MTVTSETFAWQAFAACTGEDHDLFFGRDGEPVPEKEVRERRAKQVCARCIVRTDCLADAVTGGIKFGVFGGLSPEERRELRHNYMRRIRAAKAGTA